MFFTRLYERRLAQASYIVGCQATGQAPPALPGKCVVLACETSFHDNNNVDADGCEFGPCTITSSVESCNGIDDDCNPATPIFPACTSVASGDAGGTASTPQAAVLAALTSALPVVGLALVRRVRRRRRAPRS
jgi:hypothetical protein